MSKTSHPKHMVEQRRRSLAPFAVALVAVAVAAGVAAWRMGILPAVFARTPLEGAAVEDAADARAGTAEPSRDPSAFAALIASGEVRSIRLVGDSVTAGFGTDGYVDPDASGSGALIYDNGRGEVHHETTHEAKSWANAFRAWAAEQGVESFVNAGVNGAFMWGLADNPAAWLGAGADVVVVALGTNDAGYFGPDEYRQSAQAALAAVAQKSRLVVVLSPASDLRPESTLVEPAASLADVLRPICEENGYLFVDGSAAVAPEQFCEDGLHPNTEGSLAIWDCLRAGLGIV